MAVVCGRRTGMWAVQGFVRTAAMLGDADPAVRAEAVGIIVRTYETPDSDNVRPFRAPGSVGATTALNDSAPTYQKLVGLDRATLEQPLAKAMTSDQLEESLLTGTPYHMWSTERAVMLWLRRPVGTTIRASWARKGTGHWHPHRRCNIQTASAALHEHGAHQVPSSRDWSAAGSRARQSKSGRASTGTVKQTRHSARRDPHSCTA